MAVGVWVRERKGPRIRGWSEDLAQSGGAAVWVVGGMRTHLDVAAAAGAGCGEVAL